MSFSLFIDGAAGTTGLEIVQRLAMRPEFSIIALDEQHRKDAKARQEALQAADFAILCLHDDAAREAVALAEGSRVRIIDASCAHRVASGWTYGFPEIIGCDIIASANRLSNPGCYATGFIALMAPLVRTGMLAPDWPYAINAVSGYSGGGKALISRFETDTSIAYRAYGLGLDHKHLPEMQAYTGLAQAPLFAPAVVPAHRGMVVEVPLPLAAMRAAGYFAGEPHAMRSTLATFYAGSPLVRVMPATTEELLLHRQSPVSDRLDLFVMARADGTQALLVALLDNLGKGASGAAVQSLNLMAGLSETMGLTP